MIKLVTTIFIGGGVGSVLRFWISQWVQAKAGPHFPWGVLTVNVVGSFLIGLLGYLLVNQLHLSSALRIGILIGVLGGFTTFSSFSMETISLFNLGLYFQAGLNVLANVIFCLLATGLGLWVAQQI